MSATVSSSSEAYEQTILNIHIRNTEYQQVHKRLSRTPCSFVFEEQKRYQQNLIFLTYNCLITLTRACAN